MNHGSSMELFPAVASFPWRGGLMVLLVSLIVISIGQTKPLCSHSSQYTIKAPDGTLTCENCPLCKLGTGLLIECGSLINPGDRKGCDPCPHGVKFNDHKTPAAVTCRSCNEQENREVNKECTPSQNTEYGPCIKNFYYRDGEDRCVPCSCCTGSNSQVVKKCQDDGLPVNMQCKEVYGQICPTISTATAHPTLQSSSIPQYITKMPAGYDNSGKHDVEIQNDLKSETDENPHWTTYAAVGMAVFGLMVVVPFVYLCKNDRRSRGSGHVGDGSYNVEPAADGNLLDQPSSTRQTYVRALGIVTDPCEHQPLMAAEFSREEINMEEFADPQQQPLLPTGSGTEECVPPDTLVQVCSPPTNTPDSQQQPLLPAGGDASTGEFLPPVSPEPQQHPWMTGSDPGAVEPDEEYAPPVPPEPPDPPDQVHAIPAVILDCRLSEMPAPLKYYLCIELDAKESNKANCHDVAREFSLTEEESKWLKIVMDKPNGSPTEALFDTLALRGDREPLVRKLVEVLIHLGRGRIVDDWKTIECKKNVGKVRGALIRIKGYTLSKTNTDIEEFKESVQQNGYQLQDNNSGGNCMFHALSDQLRRLGEHETTEPGTLREILVDYLEQNPTLDDGTELVELVDGYSSWDHYLADMRKDGTLGDHLVLLAAANIFQRSIRVISLPHNEETVVIHTNVSADWMVLGHVAELHFVSLKPPPDCLLSDMAPALTDYLCMELDVKKPYQANCHDVAKEFGLSIDDLKALEIVSQKPEGSPTDSLFSMLIAQKKKQPTVNDLVKILIKVQRWDIVENWNWVANKRKQVKNVA